MTDCLWARVRDDAKYIFFCSVVCLDSGVGLSCFFGNLKFDEGCYCMLSNVGRGVGRCFLLFYYVRVGRVKG